MILVFWLDTTADMEVQCWMLRQVATWRSACSVLNSCSPKLAYFTVLKFDCNFAAYRNVFNINRFDLTTSSSTHDYL